MSKHTDRLTFSSGASLASGDVAPRDIVIKPLVGEVKSCDVAEYLRAHMDSCPELRNPQLAFGVFAKRFRLCGKALREQRNQGTKKGDGFTMVQCEPQPEEGCVQILIEHAFDGEAIRKAEVTFSHLQLLAWIHGPLVMQRAGLVPSASSAHA